MKLITYYTNSHYDLYKNYLIPSIKDSFDIFQKCGVQISPDGNYFNKGFGETTKDKIVFLLECLNQSNENETILFCDVDIIFLRSVKEYLEQFSEYDMVFQDGFGGLNTGFFIMKNNQKVKNLLDSVIKNCHMYHDDQITLNFLIKNTDIKYTIFDDRVMSPATCLGSTIWTNEEIEIPNDTLVFHACWCAGVENKIRLLDYVRDYKKS